jgi:autotransporter-associated beta strand protein
MHEKTVGHKLAVSFDDQHLTSVTTTTYSAWSYCATEVELTQGSHELKLYGESQYEDSGKPTDCSIIVDDIELRPAGECCLTVEVPEGVEFNNSKLNLKGDIKLVKTGAGTLTASSAAAQMYTGGTTVEAGVLKLNASGSKYPLGAAKDMPVIRVAAGAKFDLNGKYDLNGYQFIVAGGKLANTGGDMPADSASLPGRYSIHRMTLEADSSLDSPRNFLFRGNAGGVIDLGGHTLTATMAGGKTLFLCNSMQKGRLLFNTPEAIFYVGNGDSGEISLSETDFDIYGKLAINASVSVRNWTVRSPVGAGLSSCDATVSVARAFAPVTDYFCNTLLLDGATLDLSERSTALDVKSLDTANDNDYRLSFADNAHVMVGFGERCFREQVKVVDWTPDTKPSNLATLKFKASPENRYRSRLVVTEKGIWAGPATGMRIIVR